MYFATALGIQVCDQAGRVNCIIPTPNGRVANLAFGGEKFDTIFATCGDRIYSRQVKVQGANAFDRFGDFLLVDPVPDPTKSSPRSCKFQIA